MINNNYYEILGIDTNASCEEIKRAYRRLSLIYHPDKNTNDNDKSTKFKILNQAYQTLSNDILRDKYNRENNIINNSVEEKFYNNGSHSNSQTSEIFNNTNDKRFTYPFSFNETNDMYNNRYQICNEIYDIYRNNHHTNPATNHLTKPKSIDILKEIDFTQSYYGDNIPILINREITVKNEKYAETETIYITIENGIDNNEIITVENKGNIFNNIYGDVKIKIILIKHQTYKRNGLDLLYTKNITFKESICGFTFSIKHINGKMYTINNNTGVIINPNYTTSVPKLGFKKSHNIGNLIINYTIEYPAKLNQDIIKKLNNIL